MVRGWAAGNAELAIGVQPAWGAPDGLAGRCLAATAPRRRQGSPLAVERRPRAAPGRWAGWGRLLQRQPSVLGPNEGRGRRPAEQSFASGSPRCLGPPARCWTLLDARWVRRAAESGCNLRKGARETSHADRPSHPQQARATRRSRRGCRGPGRPAGSATVQAGWRPFSDPLPPCPQRPGSPCRRSTTLTAGTRSGEGWCRHPNWPWQRRRRRPRASPPRARAAAAAWRAAADEVRARGC